MSINNQVGDLKKKKKITKNLKDFLKNHQEFKGFKKRNHQELKKIFFENYKQQVTKPEPLEVVALGGFTLGGFVLGRIGTGKQNHVDGGQTLGSYYILFMCMNYAFHA